MTWRTTLIWLLPVIFLAGLYALIELRPGSDERVRRMPEIVGAGFPRRVIPTLGQPFELAAAPQRVLLANSGMVDIVVELISPDRVVALPEQALTWSNLCVIDRGFRAKASFREIDIEKAFGFKPDLVFCGPFNQALVLGRPDGMSLPTLSVPVPQDLSELLEVIALAGRALGAEPEADALIAASRARVAALGVSAASGERRTAMVYSNLGDGGWSAGSNTLQHTMLELAGFRNVIAVLGRKGNVRVTHEDMLAADPDVIVVSARFGEWQTGTMDYLQREEALQHVSAVREKCIIALHPRLFSALSQEILTAAEQLQAELKGEVKAR